VIFVDANVFIYAVGRPHPLREEAQAFFDDHLRLDTPLATSAEVLQELLHVYRPSNRLATFDRAVALAESLTVVWPIEHDDVRHARALAGRHPALSSRDLIHLACCQRRKAADLQTYDEALREAWAA
jgi:predicted nucleic acid-binding protein